VLLLMMMLMLLHFAGASYGGVYVPLLTQRLLQHNKRLT
jgi:carboxypeptidase C (cathepsin A)